MRGVQAASINDPPPRNALRRFRWTRWSRCPVSAVAVTPLPHNGPVSGKRFQILSLDGGGYKGVFTAAVLACLEDDLGIRIQDSFDLIAGTSTGGIIALAIGAGLPPSRVVDFYRDNGHRIFGLRRLRRPRQILRAKYSAAPLRTALEDVLGDKHFCESPVRLVIPSYDLHNDTVRIFRTPHHQRLRRDYKERMVDIALATSAAPTYLPAHALRGQRLVDGGLFANNPALVALTEAVGTLGVALDDIRVFSLGTTSTRKERPSRLDRGGLLPWATELTDILLRAQSLAAKNAVHHLLPGGEAQQFRLDPVVPQGVLSLDGLEPGKLRGYAEKEALHAAPRFNEMFAGHSPEAYEPLYTLTKGPPPDDNDD